jgi:hypothetical protein
MLGLAVSFVVGACVGVMILAFLVSAEDGSEDKLDGQEWE